MDFSDIGSLMAAFVPSLGAVEIVKALSGHALARRRQRIEEKTQQTEDTLKVVRTDAELDLADSKNAMNLYQGLFTTLEGQIAAVRSDHHTEIAALRSEAKAEREKMYAEHIQCLQMHGELLQKIGHLEAKTEHIKVGHVGPVQIDPPPLA